MEATVNRNTAFLDNEQDFKSDRDRILDIMKREDTPLSASDIHRITRLSTLKTISVQSARSRLNELKNFFQIKEHHSSINPVTKLNNTTYRLLNPMGSIAEIQSQITLYNNNINMLSSDINTMVNMMFVSEPSIKILEKQLIKFKAKLNGLYSALEYFKLK